MTMMTDDELKAVIIDPNFSHTRAGNGLWRDLAWIYHRDPSSPTGVKFNSSAEIDRVTNMCRSVGKAYGTPLSPTEKR